MDDATGGVAATRSPALALGGGFVLGGLAAAVLAGAFLVLGYVLDPPDHVIATILVQTGRCLAYGLAAVAAVSVATRRLTAPTALAGLGVALAIGVVSAVVVHVLVESEFGFDLFDLWSQVFEALVSAAAGVAAGLAAGIGRRAIGMGIVAGLAAAGVAVVARTVLSLRYGFQGASEFEFWYEGAFGSVDVGDLVASVVLFAGAAAVTVATAALLASLGGSPAPRPTAVPFAAAPPGVWGQPPAAAPAPYLWAPGPGGTGSWIPNPNAQPGPPSAAPPAPVPPQPVPQSSPQPQPVAPPQAFPPPSPQPPPDGPTTF